MTNLPFPEISISYKVPDIDSRPVIQSPEDSYNALKEAYSDCMQHHEEVWCLFLNQGARLLGLSCVARGGISQTLVDERLILQTALLANASSVVLSHNHPSGQTEPGRNDDAMTSKVKVACKAVGITLLDHLIITASGYRSYSEEGNL